MEDCLFCKIIKGEIPCSKIYEDENILAFLDIGPVNKGHTLIVPKKHSTNIFDIENEELMQIMKVVKKLAPAVKKAVNADGLNIAQNNGKAAGQIVMHTHTHIIPRYLDDGFKHWPNKKYDDGEIDIYKKKIEDFLNK